MSLYKTHLIDEVKRDDEYCGRKSEDNLTTTGVMLHARTWEPACIVPLFVSTG